jgi:hypothetical protein
MWLYTGKREEKSLIILNIKETIDSAMRLFLFFMGEVHLILSASSIILWKLISKW